MIFWGLFACAQSPSGLHEFSIKGFTQGTTYSIKYFAKDSISKYRVDSILNVIDESMSIYNTESLISKFNLRSTKKIDMDFHMKNVIDESFKTYKLTNGYFDVTVMPLVNLWGFGPKGYTKSPSQEEIEETKRLVGVKYLKRKGNNLLKKKKGVSIDVNGIAQGYTVDVLSDFFLSRNIFNFLIEIGGEIRAHGTKPSGDFIVEVQRPFQSSDKSSYKIKLKNKAVTTSGSYEKKIKVGDEFVSHHIDPKTGVPIKTKTLSVTVIANSAMQADAIDNYLMFLSPESAIEFVDKQRDLELYVVFIENNSLKELQSSGFNNYIYK